MQIILFNVYCKCMHVSTHVAVCPYLVNNVHSLLIYTATHKGKLEEMSLILPDKIARMHLVN